jgi:hypothetical protein
VIGATVDTMRGARPSTGAVTRQFFSAPADSSCAEAHEAKRNMLASANDRAIIKEFTFRGRFGYPRPRVTSDRAGSMRT